MKVSSEYLLYTPEWNVKLLNMSIIKLMHGLKSCPLSRTCYFHLTAEETFWFLVSKSTSSNINSILFRLWNRSDHF